ncbi:MAG TPA: right-handed parallel beta-helix repeat-containing protein [Solirubrobacterales bacterium]|nr:right-handed parallel beta-helix repeat-containing protein [Solirubrobacterales bacterium]
MLRRTKTPAAGRGSRRRLAIAFAVMAALVIPAAVSAHIERASYWPKPSPDRSAKPAAGGKVPKVRSLASALNPKARGETRVVCKRGSLKRLNKSIRRSRKKGFRVRPTVMRKLTAKRAKGLRAINRRLFAICDYHQIQPAVFDSGNNDRVVVMPGLYTEPRSRKQPTDDPKCDKYEILNDRGQKEANSYRYTFHCPNDQNLIAVMGRKPHGNPPREPRWDRHGIPDLGPCIRCNFQIEGSGVSASDVVVDAGRVKAGNRGPSGVGSKKDVGIKADRADGFVLRKMTFRHALEHTIYVHEADGFFLDRFKAFYPGEYGVLTFTSDHGIIQNCEAKGAGDAGIYPGSAPDTGEQRRRGTKYRMNTQVRRCDMHHNSAGYSGTAANAVWIHHNNFYDNALGFTTDVFTAAGHPGYPQDSDLIEKNHFYSNNFNPYTEKSDVEPTIPVPVGTALWIAGGNNNTLRQNRFWNNWRRGVMLFAVPDTFVCGPQEENRQKGCKSNSTLFDSSTSHRNEFHHNLMGVAPNGSYKPNGVDFWWDKFPNNRANCWYQNRPASGHQITTDPPSLPDCNNGRNPGESVGGPALDENESELLACFSSFTANPDYDPATCPWFATPPRPQP